ncbi:MAG TPA: ferredoxin family protein [Candidatus Limnocylindria bacterium]|jgi:Pyruvate/2-oxoacid:ferredoxin oxidoreductase delta subunit|nr:ferredoxin family protein [Candidatus Limnocylindria bacterium]
MALTDLPIRVVLYEGQGAQPMGAEERLAAVTALLSQGFGVTRVGAGRPVAPADSSPLLVVGRWDSGTPPAAETIDGTRVEMADFDPATLGARAEATRTAMGAPSPGAWKPWFPVIDYDRCTNCMQCLSFCLFGVYGVDTGKRIQVQNNDNCKTNCPACSRVCPEAAIMFPKYKAGPINGDVVSDSDLNREKMKIDISALLGGDVYSLLKTRSERAKSRFSKERDSDKALIERQKCLTKLASVMSDIPPEVLMSLPSPEEIARKAEEAAARAKAALSA